MFKLKIVGMMVLIVFAMGIFLVGDALAGEKWKGRSVFHNVKWETVSVGDEEGHVFAIVEDKGIATELEGRKFQDGGVIRTVGLIDMNVKTGLGSGSGYMVVTDRDGDKYYMTWKNKVKSPPSWEGEITIVKGTGKYEGIHGKGTFVSYPMAPTQYYADWEEEVELPR